jgi:hypothetical protein
MPTKMTFGQMVRSARRARKWSAARLGVEVGLRAPELTMGEAQVRRIEGDDRVSLPSRLVAMLIEVLELNPDEAVRAAYPEVVDAVLSAAGQPGRQQGRGGIP